MEEKFGNIPAGTYSISANGGKWTISLDHDGKIRITAHGQLAVEGVYSIHEDSFWITDETGPRACTGDQKSGRYRWSLDGNRLTFVTLEDKCEGRVNALTSQPWVRDS